MQANTVSGGTSLIDFFNDAFYVRLGRNCDLRVYYYWVLGLQVDQVAAMCEFGLDTDDKGQRDAGSSRNGNQVILAGI